MQESAANLEVDLSTLGFDENPETEEDELEQDEEEFIWERCVGDQMFVFQDDKMDLILDTIITNMTPQRSPSQKPVPANILFLSARYAHYHSSPELLETLLVSAMDKSLGNPTNNSELTPWPTSLRPSITSMTRPYLNVNIFRSVSSSSFEGILRLYFVRISLIICVLHAGSSSWTIRDRSRF